MKKLKFKLFVALVLFASLAPGKEYHVSVNGSNTNNGSAASPFRTINFAAGLARPGDIITVYAGTYREWINPPMGGESDTKRIVYRASAGEKAEIKGSEVIKDWKKVKDGVWKVTIPNSFFGDYNPYKDTIGGDWFRGLGRAHHSGEVYLNGKSLYEIGSLEKVFDPVPLKEALDQEGSRYTWYCESNGPTTTIWANFHDYLPNKETVEINVRPACFYPKKTGVNFITVTGFRFSQAATQWAPPTAEQIGLIGTNWSKGWIIENNVISDSKCSGITLGKDRSTGQNVWSSDKTKDGSQHYNEVVFRALKAGWDKENIGSHVVRNNTIYNCEQAGICGSLGAVFSEISGNHIYNIWVKRQFTGDEIAGIKIHAPIDVLISNNRIHHCKKGIWMDWMAQGTRISGNLLYDNQDQDLFMEVNHGPFLIDNNILLSRHVILNMSQGGAYVHNLITGMVNLRNVSNRFTPYHFPHSTKVAGLMIIVNGDDKWYNNIFVGPVPSGSPDQISGNYGLEIYKNAKLPVWMASNIYYNNAKPYEGEKGSIEITDFAPEIKFEDYGKEVYFVWTSGLSIQKINTQVITTQILGKAKMPDVPFENPKGKPLSVDKDYFGKIRSAKPCAGPFEELPVGGQKIRIW